MKKQSRKTETVIARVPVELKLKVIQKAKRKKLKESELLRQALSFFLDKKIASTETKQQKKETP